MNFVYNGYVYDNKFLEKLTKSLNDINAFNYNKFINKFKNGSIIDGIYELEKNVCYNKNCPKIIGNKKITIEEQKSLLIEFFSSFGLGEKVKSILDGTNLNYKTNISETAPNQVGHSGYNEYLSYEVNLKNSVVEFWVLAHEMGHALSNHHVKAMTLAKATNIAEKNFGKESLEFKKQRQIYRDYTDSRQKNNIDCIGEIESHITEKLFVHFLLKKGIITEEIFNNYIITSMNSLKLNLILIIEENEIISKLHNPVTEEDCLNLYNTFKNSKHLNQLLDRIKIMAERKDNPHLNERRAHSKYRFRYVVGEVISSVWLNNYLKAGKKEQKIMQRRLINYLGKTDKTNLENVCELVLGKGTNLNSTISDFINFASTELSI